MLKNDRLFKSLGLFSLQFILSLLLIKPALLVSILLFNLVSDCKQEEFFCGIVEYIFLTAIISPLMAAGIFIILILLLKKTRRNIKKILVHAAIILTSFIVFLLALVGISSLEKHFEEERMQDQLDTEINRILENHDLPSPCMTDYETIYHEDNFEIREAKIIDADPKSDYYYGAEPEQRVLLRDRAISEYEQSTDGYSVNEDGLNLMLDIKRNDSGDVMNYASINLRVNGKYPFKSVYTDFSTEDGIHWSYSGSKLAFTYQKYIPTSGNNGTYRISIYEYKDNTLVELSEANSYDYSYAPNYINGELSYFASKEGKLRLVWNDKEVLVDRYKAVHNSYCCDAHMSRVLTDGKIIDFYGFKEDGIYHVQAGNFD